MAFHIGGSDAHASGEFQLASVDLSGGWPSVLARPDDIAIMFAHRDFLGVEPDPTFGARIDVGGRVAYLRAETAQELCIRLGGEQQLSVQIWQADRPYNWYQIDACYRGPDFDQTETTMRDLLASVRWAD